MPVPTDIVHPEKRQGQYNESPDVSWRFSGSAPESPGKSTASLVTKGNLRSNSRRLDLGNDVFQIAARISQAVNPMNNKLGVVFRPHLGRTGRLIYKAAFSLFIYAIIAEGAAAAQAPPDFQPRLTMLRSDNAAGSLSSRRAVLALWYAANELQLPTPEIPRIIVILCTPESAKVAKLPALPKRIPSQGAAAIMRDDVDGEAVYFLWIIGKNPELWFSHGVVHILSLQRGLDPARQNQSVVRVLRKLSATTSGAETRVSKADSP
jgi:hypothetical protein